MSNTESEAFERSRATTTLRVQKPLPMKLASPVWGRYLGANGEGLRLRLAESLPVVLKAFGKARMSGEIQAKTKIMARSLVDVM